jgi:hypothetical protein
MRIPLARVAAIVVLALCFGFESGCGSGSAASDGGSGSGGSAAGQGGGTAGAGGAASGSGGASGKGGSPGVDAGSAGGGGGGAVDAGRNPACVPSATQTGCCFIDADCAAGEECVGATCGSLGQGVPFVAVPGVCKMTFADNTNQCWQDSDCAHTCTGPQVCRCGASCFAADMPGTCAP